MKISILGLLICLFPYYCLAYAIQDTLVVKGNPIIQENIIDNFSQEKTVVGPNQINSTQANDIISSLRKVPGITTTRYNTIGSFGGSTGGSIFIRGIGTSRPGSGLGFYFEDIPLYMSIWNHPLLDIIPINTSSTIELYKGPHPDKYSNSLSSVNVFYPLCNKEKANIKVATGSNNLFLGWGEYGNSYKNVSYLFNAGVTKSDGHRKNSDGELKNFFNKTEYSATENIKIGLITLYTNNYSKDPGPKNNPENNDGIFKTKSFTNAVYLESKDFYIKAYSTSGNGDWLNQRTSNPDIKESLYNTFGFYGVKTKNIFRPYKKTEVIIGADFEAISGNYKKEFSNDTDEFWDGPTFNITSPFIGISSKIRLKDLVILPSIGTRKYFHSNFKEEYSPFYGTSIEYKKTKFSYGYSRGVLYPGLDVVVFSERIIPPLGDSWENLNPEILENRSFTIQTNLESISFDFSYFQMNGKDRYIIIPGPPYPFYSSVGRYDIKGVEIATGIRTNKNNYVFFGSTYTETTPESLPYTPKFSFILGNSRKIGKYKLNIDGQYIHKMYIYPFTRSLNENSSLTKDHFIANINVEYTLNYQHSTFFSVENIFGSTYEYIPDYPMPRQTFKVGLRISY